MRSIGIWTMVLVLAASASAGSPIQPSKQTQSSATSSWVGRQKESIPKAEPAGNSDTETLSAEAKQIPDVAETISAQEKESAPTGAPAIGELSVPSETPKPLAPPTTETVAPMPTMAAPTESESTAMMSDAPIDEPIYDNQQTSLGAVWQSGTPAEADPYYGRLEYLYWKTSNPAPSGKVFQSFNISLTGQSTVNSTINLNDVHTDYEMGLRALIGRNLTENFGVELGGLWVYPGTDLKAMFSQPAGTSSTGTTTNAVRVFLVPTGQQLGQASMSFRNRYWGTELNGRWHLVNNRHWTVDGLAGARYFDYAERLAFSYNLTNPSTPAAARIDRFETNNHMIGGQLGTDIQMALLEYVSLQSSNRIAILGNLQDVTVKGKPAAGMGEFTSFSNLGSHNTGAGSVLLETTPSVVFHLTPDITFQAGYTIIWLNNIMRAAEQLDLNQVGKSPQISFKNDDMFITGFTFALTANW